MPLTASHLIIEKHLTFFYAEKVAKFAEKKTVGFVLAPLNLKLLSLIGPVLHSL